MLTWIDVLALFTAAAATAVGVRKGSAFLATLPPAIVLFALAAPLLPPLSWPLLGLLAGLLSAQLAGRLDLYLSESWERGLGGLAGLVWGALLAIALWAGLPAEYSVATGAYRYPSPRLPLVVQEAVARSPFALPVFELVQKQPLLHRILLEARANPSRAEAPALPR